MNSILHSWKQFKKKDLNKIMAQIEETFPNAKFSCFSEKNGRGDYGFDETYSIGIICLIKTSIDGARRDVRQYFNSALIKI